MLSETFGMAEAKEWIRERERGKGFEKYVRRYNYAFIIQVAAHVQTAKALASLSKIESYWSSATFTLMVDGMWVCWNSVQLHLQHIFKRKK